MLNITKHPPKKKILIVSPVYQFSTTVPKLKMKYSYKENSPPSM